MVSVMKVEKAPLESYADIGGLDAQTQEIKEAVELPLIHLELYEDIGIKPPKGVILYGEPGTRKNLLAKFSSSPPSPPLPSSTRGATPTACSSISSPSPNWGCSINYYPLIQPQRNRKVRAIIEDEEDRTNVVLFDRHAQTILRQPVDSTKEMFQQVEFRSVAGSSKDSNFIVEVLFSSEMIGIGMGRTRKEAQLQAVENALHNLAMQL